jgi:hypothetical protein
MENMNANELVGQGKPFRNWADLARAVGVTRQACCKWKRVPIHHSILIEEITKDSFPGEFSRFKTRPDFWGNG